jgi:hypothetical protein
MGASSQCVGTPRRSRQPPRATLRMVDGHSHHHQRTVTSAQGWVGRHSPPPSEHRQVSPETLATRHHTTNVSITSQHVSIVEGSCVSASNRFQARPPFRAECRPLGRGTRACPRGCIGGTRARSAAPYVARSGGRGRFLCAHVDKVGRRRQLRFLKRQLVLPVSMMSQWWVRRSSMAVVILASPNTWGQSAKARLVVISSEVFS